MSETTTDIRDGDTVRVSYVGTYRNRDALMRHKVSVAVEGGTYYVPVLGSAELALIDAKGYPWYGDEIRKGDCDRLPASTIVRSPEGAVFLKTAYQGKWLRAGALHYATESQIVARGCVVIWLPEGAERPE